MRIFVQLLMRMARHRLPAMFFLLFAAIPLMTQTAPAVPAPVKLTAEQDRQRLLDLLKIKEQDQRRAPSTDALAPNAANYDESKANVYPDLPDPLVHKNGQPVTSAHGWAQRREEIKEDFDREILGRPPANLPKVTWEVLSTTPETYGGIAVVTKRLQGHVDNSSYPQLTVNIEMTLTTPAHAKGPVPVLMELAFATDFQNALVRPVPTPVPGAPGSYGVQWQPVLERGWGFAVLSPTSYQADDGAGLTEGIIGLMNKGQPRTLDDWGALRAWAWGASRALDYLQTDKAVNAQQLGLVGHSRFGKAVLVTLAYYPGFAIAYASSSGEGGAKLYRHIFGEQISNLTSPSLYHWMAGNFLKYGGPLTPADLPVDNHELIALCAPRAVFIGGGSDAGDGYANPNGDAWADPRGMFLAEVAAGPVYRLLGHRDLGTTEFPPPGTALVTGDLAFRQHNGGHTPAPNWPAFLDFAARYLHAPVGKAGPTKSANPER
jgi:hypothetical protein